MKKIIIIVSLIILLQSIFSSKPIAKKTDPIVIQINEIRKSYNLNPLTSDTRLNKSAQYKACDLKRGYWAHVSPEGTEPWDLMKTYGYSYSRAGENLAKNCTDNVCMKLWLESGTHLANILNKNYKNIGVGRCDVYIVTHFGNKPIWK